MQKLVCLVALALLLVGCAAARLRLSYPLDSPVRVQLEDVREPQITWAREELPELDVLRPGWLLVTEAPDVVVRYVDLSEPHTVGDFTRNSDYVQLDLVKTHGERVFKSVLAHELIHWFIDAHSSQPQRSVYHLCEFAWNERAPPLCHPSIATRAAIMSAVVPRRPILTPTEDDIKFFDWAMGN